MAFQSADADKNGQLSMQELYGLLVQMGVFNGVPPQYLQATVQQEFMKVDSNRSGGITFDEFVPYYTHILQSLQQRGALRQMPMQMQAVPMQMQGGQQMHYQQAPPGGRAPASGGYSGMATAGMVAGGVAVGAGAAYLATNPDVAAGIGDGIVDGAGFVGGGIVDGANFVGEGAGDAFGAVADWAPGAFDAVGDFGGDAVGAIGDFGGDAGDFLGDAIGSLGDFF